MAEAGRPGPVTLGVVAHVDAGKTTLSEQLLFRCGAVRACGRVDRGDACLDFTAVERRRGITVYSAQAALAHGGRDYFLVDTPGHADFSPDTERCLQVLDTAILVVSAADGLQAGTERLWRQLRARRIPTVCFLNKLDCPGADPDAALARMRARLDGTFCDLRRGLTEEAREQAAETSDAALAAYLDGRFSDEAAWAALSAAMMRGDLCPVLAGSALSGAGVEALLDALDRLCRTDYDPVGPLEVLAYQVRRDGQGNRVVFAKVLSGTLRPRQSLAGEKVHELRRCLGEKWTPLRQASAGELTALTGPQALRPGDRAGETLLAREAQAPPPLQAEVLCDAPPARLLEAFRRMEDEEPTLALRWREDLGRLHLAIQGEIQLEILAQAAAERFGLAVRFGECQVVYRETVARPVRGCGHFEPLRHYAEVHLLLEPGPRGSGVTFASRCATDDLALRWQRLIETHVLERQHPGALTGAALTDVRVVLLAGRAHEKHTEGGDFRQAVYRAIRQALFQAENVLLEPYYRFTAEAEPAAARRIQADLVTLGGTCAPPETLGGMVRLTGRCPVASMLPYSRGFAAMTRGRGSLSLEPDGYEPCRDQASAVAASGYDRARDAENPADSVFCDHGAGRTIPWDRAAEMMHIRL